MEAGVREHRQDIEEEAGAIGGGAGGDLAWSRRQLERGDAHVSGGEETSGCGASPPPAVAQAPAPVVVVAVVAGPVPVHVGALVCRMMLVVVETPAMIVTSLHMEVARPVTSHVVTASTEAGLEMWLEMIGGGRGEEAGAHQHPGVSLGMEVDIGHPLMLLVQVSRHRGWYRGPGGAWELDHPRAGLTRAPVAAGQSSRELTGLVSLEGASVPGEEGGLEPIGRGDHTAVWRQTGAMVGDGGAVVTPGGLEEDGAGGGAAVTGGRGAGEQRGALAGGELAAGEEVTRQAGPGEELRLETTVTQAERELIRHLANGDIRGAGD